jgi:hypothetical protein
MAWCVDSEASGSVGIGMSTTNCRLISPQWRHMQGYTDQIVSPLCDLRTPSLPLSFGKYMRERPMLFLTQEGIQWALESEEEGFGPDRSCRKRSFAACSSEFPSYFKIAQWLSRISARSVQVHLKRSSVYTGSFPL